MRSDAHAELERLGFTREVVDKPEELADSLLERCAAVEPS
jgi:hypothetical protein